jgi:hypothetical protein
MIRRNFIKAASLVTGAGLLSFKSIGATTSPDKTSREYWLDHLLRISSPVLNALANNSLKRDMPIEAKAGASGRNEVSHLEAFGRTLAGLAPWLELTDVSENENKLRMKYLDLALRSIKNAVTPGSSDYMNFTKANQPLVDAAFFAHSLIRAPKQLWGNLDKETQQHVITALKATRVIKPFYSNWLLFSAMVEAALLKFSGEYDPMRVDYAIKQHQSWYKGDGMYGDGPDFHFDYYNSFVIQPMLLDVTKVLREATDTMENELTVFTQRSQRYAAIMERLISPEGTFPPVGRSLAYRCGAFQLLAQMSLQKLLPAELKPGQVRGALSAVIKTTLEAPATFDKNGWLTIGFCGHQPSIGEVYISTGSLYLCTVAFLPLGLPAADEFWSSPVVDWTSKRAFSGQDFPIDKAL